MTKLNVVIVGAGRAGAAIHLPAFQSLPEVAVCGICDPDLSRARAVGERHGLPGAYESLTQALDRHRVGVVSICTPPQTHLTLAKEAMERGWSVLLEKPMTVTLPEAEQLLQCRERTGTKLSVVHQNKFTPGMVRMQDIVRGGHAGDVLQLDMAWFSNGDQDRMIADPTFWCHTVPGGRWAESLPHQLYVAYTLVGRMTLLKVAARKRTDRWPWMTADEVAVLLRSDTGYVSIRMSATPAEKKRSLNLLHGTRQSYLFSYRRATPVRPFPPTVRETMAGAVHTLGRVTREVMQRSRKRGPHWYVIRQFVDHVLRDAPPPTGAHEALHVMELTHHFGIAFEHDVERRSRT